MLCKPRAIYLTPTVGAQVDERRGERGPLFAFELVGASPPLIVTFGSPVTHHGVRGWSECPLLALSGHLSRL